MSSVVKSVLDGEQIELDRQNWLTQNATEFLAEAVDNPKIGPDRTLTILLHHGLGLPLNLVAKLLGTTKNVVAKRIITGTKRLKGKTPWSDPFDPAWHAAQDGI